MMALMFHTISLFNVTVLFPYLHPVAVDRDLILQESVIDLFSFCNQLTWDGVNFMNLPPDHLIAL